MVVEVRVGPEILRAYKRLDYTPSHALAEFVDNATQSYLDHRADLDSLATDQVKLKVTISLERKGSILEISDTAFGMDRKTLNRALHLGTPPPGIKWRSKYGLGMKTAAFWFGNEWSITTCCLGSGKELQVTLRLGPLARGKTRLRVSEKLVPRDSHYTRVRIRDLNHPIRTRSQDTVKKYLTSMYRADLSEGWLQLDCLGERLQWESVIPKLELLADGSPHMREFSFTVDSKRVSGWAGVLQKGSRANAGFSMFHAGRIVKGWPDAWRPPEIFGQLLGSNNLLNQRLVGEVHFDDFDVTHTKDNILFVGDEEEKVELEIKERIRDLMSSANTARRGADERGPSFPQIRRAVQEIQDELLSPELADIVTIEPAPNESAVRLALAPLLTKATGTPPDFTAQINGLYVAGYLTRDSSVNDPYLAVEATTPSRLQVVVNMNHPHISQLDANGFLDHLRHCVYDGIAEWLAKHKSATIDPDTIKYLKDRLLRLSFEMEIHADASRKPE